MCIIIINFVKDKYIIMNDVKALLIATTVLAIGGLGLYMYKSEESEFDDDISETSSQLSEMSDSSELSDVSNLEEEDTDNYIPKKSNKGTKKNSKKNGGTRKKH